MYSCSAALTEPLVVDHREEELQLPCIHNPLPRWLQATHVNQTEPIQPGRRRYQEQRQ